LADSEEVTAGDLPLNSEQRTETERASETETGMETALGEIPLNEILDRLERKLIVRAMAEADQVKTRAAEILRIKPSALYYKLDKYGLE
jgi:two-component system response regulator HydG